MMCNLQSTALARTVLPAVSMDSNLKLQVLSPICAREQLAAAPPSQEEEGDSRRGFWHSQALQLKRHFVAVSLGVAMVGAGEVSLLDPSPQEHLEAAGSAGGEWAGQLLEGHVLVVVDLEGSLCLVEGSGGEDISLDKELQLCEAASRHAQAHVAPLLRPLLP